MNIFERALTPETYTNALKDPGSAVKNVVSDPGFGLVAGAMLGMPQFGGFSALQAAMMTGGISALATGSLQKGLMTGLSAYGGAGLSGSLMNAGTSDIAANAVHEGAIGGQTAGFGNQALQYPSVANASALDKISAGFGSVASSPEAAWQFTKDNYGKALMAAGPIIADQMVPTKTPLPDAGSLSGPSYIRPYAMRRTVRKPEQGVGSREQRWFDTEWERGDPYKAANGGIVALADGGMTSQGAYDFLMGKTIDASSPPQVNTSTKAPTYEGHYEYDAISGTSRWVPARNDSTPQAPVVPPLATGTSPKTYIGGGGQAPSHNADAGAANLASLGKFGDAVSEGLQGLVGMLNQAPISVQVAQALLNAVKNSFQNSSMGMANAHNALSQANTVNGLTPGAVAMGGLGMANANQGISAANSAAAIGMGNAAGNAGAAGTSTGPGGMAGTTGQAGVAASVAGGNTGAAGAAGPGSSGGGGGVGGGGGNGSGASSAGGSSAGSAYSDVRMKDNIKPIGHALDKVRKLDGITYDMNGKRGAGLAAQQVEKVLPEVVHKDGKGMRKLDYGNTVGLLVEAVKELDSKKNGKAGGGMLGGYASGGLSDLGSYSDGGRLLRGPGDGVSDSIPATIGKGQPARLADGEFVVPARIVSEIGNGSTEAGARKLYAMMDRIQSARRKTVGKGKVAANTKADKYLPA
jgi:hypothetical protein